MPEVQLKHVEPMTVVSLSFTGPYEQTQDKLEELMSWLLRAGHPYCQPPVALYYDDPEKVPPADLRAEVCLAIAEECEPADDVKRKELPAVTVAFAAHEGPYSGISQVYQEIFGWMAKNGYRQVQDTPSREIFLRIPDEVDDPKAFLTEIQVPVEKV